MVYELHGEQLFNLKTDHNISRAFGLNEGIRTGGFPYYVPGPRTSEHRGWWHGGVTFPWEQRQWHRASKRVGWGWVGLKEIKQRVGCLFRLHLERVGCLFHPIIKGGLPFSFASENGGLDFSRPITHLPRCSPINPPMLHYWTQPIISVSGYRTRFDLIGLVRY